MAISLVGTIQTGVNNNGGNVTLTFDGTPAQDDVVYVICGQGASGTADPAPLTVGYSQIHQHTAATPWVGLHRKVLGASPDASAIVKGSGSAQSATAAISIVLRGIDTTTPEDATATASGPTTSIDPDNPAITTVTDNAWVIPIVAYDGTDADITHHNLVAAGYTVSAAFEAHGVDTARTNLGIVYKEVTPAGVEDPPAYIIDSSTWYTITLAVRPAGVGAPGLVVPVHYVGRV